MSREQVASRVANVSQGFIAGLDEYIDSHPGLGEQFHRDASSARRIVEEASSRVSSTGETTLLYLTIISILVVLYDFSKTFDTLPSWLSECQEAWDEFRKMELASKHQPLV